MITLAEYFAGIGGVSTGAVWADVKPVYACEYDPKDFEISHFYRNVHRLNCPDQFFDLRPIEQVNQPYPADIAHFSPSCRSFTTHPTRNETGRDINHAHIIAKFATSYDWVTLEQVAAYRDSQSYQIIQQALTGAGYRISEDVINMADYSISQSRLRFWAIATRLPVTPIIPRPNPANRRTWYAAISHLIPALKPWYPDKTTGYVKKLNLARSRHPESYRFLVSRSALSIAPDTKPCFTLRRIFARSNGLSVPHALSFVNQFGWYDATTLPIFRLLSGFPDFWKTYDSHLNFAGFGDCVPPSFYRQLLLANPSIKVIGGDT